MIVADSDVLIDALRGAEGAEHTVGRALEHGNLLTTAVTAFELRSGARSTRVSQAVETLLAARPILPFDAEAADRAASLRLELERMGKPIGMADYMIAGICLVHSARLPTRNRRHCERVPGLALVDVE